MAVKTATYLGAQIVNTDDNGIGYTSDDNGLSFLPDTEQLETTQSFYAVTEHRVNDTYNPLWNQVNYKLSDNLTYSTSLLNGHITLYGLDQMGNETAIMQHRYSADDINSSAIKTLICYKVHVQEQ